MTKQVSKEVVALMIVGATIVGFLTGVAIGLGDGKTALAFLPCLGGLVSLPALLLALKEERE